MEGKFPKKLRVPPRDLQVRLAKFAKVLTTINQVKKEAVNSPAEKEKDGDTAERSPTDTQPSQTPVLFDTTQYASIKWLEKLKELNNQLGLTDAAFLYKFSTIISSLNSYQETLWTNRILDKLGNVTYFNKSNFKINLQNKSNTFRITLSKLARMCTAKTLVETIKGLLEKQFQE